MRINHLFVAVVLTLVFCQIVHAKEWYQLYEDGKKAVEKGNCAEGVKALKEAVQKNPRGDLKARPYGTITWEYIPHFYLAKCAAQSGDYAAADMYLNEAKKIDMYSSSKAPEFRTLVKTVQDKLKPTTTTQPGNAQIAKNNQNQNTNKNPNTTSPANPNPQVNKPNTTTPSTTTPQESEMLRQARLNRALDEARSAYSAGNFDEARNAANRALMMDRNNREASKLLSQISSRETEVLESQARKQKIDDAKRAMNRGDLSVAESMIVQLRAEYPNDRTIESLANDIQKKRSEQMASMNEATKRKENERQVIRAYFEGRYVAAAEFADTYLSQYPNSWRLHFYKGCALAAQGLTDEKNKDNRLAQARAAFRKARESGGDIKQPSQISPKIWDIYRNS
jgi:tetratricopeptide (TPR) repeat protein